MTRSIEDKPEPVLLLSQLKLLRWRVEVASLRADVISPLLSTGFAQKL